MQFKLTEIQTNENEQKMQHAAVRKLYDSEVS